MTLRTAALIVAGCMAAAPAAAEFAKVNDESQFRTLITGKKLTRPLIELEVTPTGDIKGRGARWEVTGSWVWQDGYFCRDLFWGGDSLGYNCQEVAVTDGRIRFTSDRGNGSSADFRLKQN